MRIFVAIVLALLIGGSATGRSRGSLNNIDQVAEDYVRLTLEIGAREEGYVDAYYGPPEWKQAAQAHPRGIPELAAAAASLQARLRELPASTEPMTVRRRAFLDAQLTAARTRLRMAGGERLSFAEEARGLFGVTPQLRPLADYDAILARLDQLVPGEGPLSDRVDAFQDRFVVPPDRVDGVMRATIAECRRRTLSHFQLPAEETVNLELIDDRNRSWTGYNYYQGNYRSRIQVNTHLPIRISRAVDLGCHEGYPGHHVYNALLERDLARGRGWVEYMIYPLYSPQSLIAEGSANYGIDLAFPGPQRAEFEGRVLYPIAGLPAAEAERFVTVVRAVDDLASARFTIARDYLEGRIDRARAVALIRQYMLLSQSRAEQSLLFVDQYRSYVINYGLGKEMVRRFVEQGATPAERWARMHRILSEPTVPADLERTSR